MGAKKSKVAGTAGTSKGRTPKPTKRASKTEGRPTKGGDRPTNEQVWRQQDELDKLRSALFGSQGVSGLAEILAEGLSKQHDDAGADEAPEGVERVLRGHATEDDLRPVPEIVRSFMSSTFTDTRAERDCFVAFCVPLLRAHCRNAGYEFELSEMRWGINSDVSAQHKTAEICLRELSRCLETSATMHFIGIVGDKYGFRPFPAAIEEDEFNSLFQHCANDDQRALLETWFQLDTNSIPSVFRLRPVYEVLPDYSAEVQNEASRAWWAECFEPMQSALREAARSLYDNDIESRRPFEASVTELEMRLGFTSPGATSLLLSRHLEGDVHHAGYRDTVDEAQAHLEDLRAWAAAHASETKERSLEWHEGGIDPVAYPAHAAYIRSTLEMLCRMYAEKIAVLPSRALETTIIDEVKAHARFALRKQQDFVGRTDLVERITEAVQSEPATLVSGISGSGKTALAARVLMDIEPAFALCVRFIGTTSESSAVEPLLHSVCAQIQAIYGGPALDPTASFDELAEAFREDFICRGTADRPLCVVLDSLDQLPPGSSMAWLPDAGDLPPNCHLLLTAMTDATNRTLLKVRATVRCTEIAVPVMRLSDVDEVLDTWLDQLERRDTPAQRDFCKRVLDQADEPTYLMLRTVFNQLTQWASFTPLPENWYQVTDVASLLETFFEDLEQKHGDLFTQAALGLLTSARDGLSQPELEDLLSLNDEVLNAVFRWWVPPVPRIPPLVVTRLLADLEPFLVLKTGNTKAWFHRQFREYAARRYASRHQELAAYFGNKAAQAEFRLDHAVNGDAVVLSADRMILAQPPLLDGEAKPNMRVLRELVHHIRLGPPETRLELLEVVFDFAFLQAAANGFALQDVTDQIVLASEDPVFDLAARHQLRILVRCIVLSLPSVIRYPACLAEQLWNRLARTSSHDDHLFRLREAVERRHMAPAPAMLTSLEPVLTFGDGDLKMSFGVHRTNPYFVRTIDADRFVTGAADGELKVWDYRTGQLMQTLNKKADVGGATRLAVHRPVDDATSAFIVSGFYGGCIRVWNADSGTLVQEIPDAHEHWIYQVCPVRVGIDDDEHARHPLPLIVSGSKATDVKVWHVPALQGTDAVGKPQCLHTLTDSTYGVNCVDASYATEIAAPTTARAPLFVVAGSNTDVRVWKTQDVWSSECTPVHVLGSGSKPYNGVQTFWRQADRRRYIVAASEDTCVHVWDMANGAHIHRLQGHTGQLRGLTVHTGTGLTGNSDQIVIFSSSDDNTCRAWDMDSEALLRTFDAHSRTCRTMALSCTIHSMVTVSFDQKVSIWDIAPETWNGVQAPASTPEAPRDSPRAQTRKSTPKFDATHAWASKLAADAKGIAEFRAICMAQVGAFFIAGWTDGTLTIMDATAATQTIQVSTSKTRTWVTGVAGFKNGESLATVSHDGTLRTLALAPGKRDEGFSSVVTLSDDELNDLVVTPADLAIVGGEDWKVYVVSLDDGKVARVLKGHHGPVQALSFNRSFLLSTAQDRSVHVWDLDDFATVARYAGAHTDWVPAASFLGGNAAVTASENGELFYWPDVSLDEAVPTRLQSVQVSVGYTCIRAAPDLGCFVATLVDGSFEIWSYDAADSSVAPSLLTSSLQSMGHIDGSPYVGQANCAAFLQARSAQQAVSRRKSRLSRPRGGKAQPSQVSLAVAFHNSGIALFALQMQK